MPYRILIADNFHFMDEDAQYEEGEYAKAEEAIKHCMDIVDDYLVSAYQPGMTASELWESYTLFGEDPSILSVGKPKVCFSAWDYAKGRCDALCAS